MKRRLKKFLALAVCMVVPAAMVRASYVHANGDDNTLSTFDIFFMLMQVIIFLVVIIGIFLFIMKIISKKNKMFQSGRSIKSIGGMGLGQNKSVQLVQIGRSLYVLGVGNDVNLVSKIDDQEEVQYIIEHFHSKTSGEWNEFSSISSWIRRLLGKEARSEELSSASFQEVFQEKVKHMTNRQQQVEKLLSHDSETNQERSNDKS